MNSALSVGFSLLFSFELLDLAGCHSLVDIFWVYVIDIVTYAEFLGHVQVLRDHFRPFLRQTFVGLQLSDPLECTAALFALWDLGLCPVLLSPHFPQEMIQTLKA